MKICSKCSLEKDYSEFYKDKSKKDNCRNSCKECDKLHNISNKEKIKIYQKNYASVNAEKEYLRKENYRKNNKEKIKERNKIYNEDNKLKIRECQKTNKEKRNKINREKYKNIENKKERNKIQNDKQKEYRKKYYKSNKEKISKDRKEYYSENSDKIKSRSKKYKTRKNIKRSNIEKLKRLNNPIFRLTEGIRTSIRNSIKKRGFTKKSKTYQILGCSFIEFKLYLESKFESWMSWQNYGKYNGELNFGWDIDHIIPSSSAKTEEEIIKLNHYTNLQPLCSKTNRDIKKDSILG